MEKDNLEHRRGLADFREIVTALYFAVIVIMIVIVGANILLKDSAGAYFGLEGFEKIDAGWTTETGKEFDAALIDKLRTEKKEYVSIYRQVPENIGKDESLLFRSKNCRVSVLVGGEKVYTTELVNAPFYNHSPGTRWNVVGIDAADGGKTVELRVYQAYQDGRAKVDNFYYGDRAAITLHLINAKLGGSIISLLIFFVGLVFLAAWVVLNWHRSPKNNSLLWLGIFAIIAASWSLLETNLFQFFSRDLRLIQVVDNMMLVIGGLPLYLYMDSVYRVFRSKVVRLLCGLDLAYVILATLFQLCGLWDYHQTLNGAILTYGIVTGILIMCLAKQRKKLGQFESNRDRFFHYLQQSGIFILGISLMADLARYLMSDVLDRAFIIRIGLLCFIICFGAGNLYQMVQLVKKGMEAEFISQLAYLDGLTRVGNRTAYVEQLQRLKESHSDAGLALVMFDINNLKWVNDTLGHKDGDELILLCAEVVQEAFTPGWYIYRIGGDEFVALTYGENVRMAYGVAAQRFAERIEGLNGKGERAYTIAMAHGAAFAKNITEETVEAAEKEADRNMYQDKYRLKFSEQGKGYDFSPGSLEGRGFVLDEKS